MKSLNEMKGTTISELEATLILCKRLIEHEIKDGNKGLIIAKGKPNEVKLTYKKALKVVESIENCFAYKGCKSFGICQTCEKFDPSKFPGQDLGYCGSEMKHKYDTCQNHSKSGGGHGL